MRMVVVATLMTTAGISYGSRLTFKDTDAAAAVEEEQAADVLGRIQLD